MVRGSSFNTSISVHDMGWWSRRLVDGIWRFLSWSTEWAPQKLRLIEVSGLKRAVIPASLAWIYYVWAC